MATDEPHAAAAQERPCRVCGQRKPPDSFVSGPPSRVRKHRVCRECRRQAGRAYRDAHPEQRERFNAWRRALHHTTADGDRRPACDTTPPNAERRTPNAEQGEEG